MNEKCWAVADPLLTIRTLANVIHFGKRLGVLSLL